MALRTGQNAAGLASLHVREHALPRRSISPVLLVLLFFLAAATWAEEPREIVSKAVQQVQKSNHLREQYTFKQDQKMHELDARGAVVKTRTTETEVMFFGGKRVERLMAKDGKPLPRREAQKEREKVDRAAVEASRLSAPELKARLDKQDRDLAKNTNWLNDVSKAFHFTLQREDSLNGRPVYVINAAPDKSYAGKNAGLFHKVQGTMYIDKQLYTLVRLDSEFLDSYWIGLFLGKVNKGTRVSFEQARINDEIWFPTRFTFRAEARALVMSIREDGEITYSDYKKFRTESRVVSTGQPE